MGAVIGQVLPAALGVAISPVPIIAIILMLLAPRAGTASLGFFVGWVLGVAAVVTAVALLVDPVDDSQSSSPSTMISVLKILLGAAAALLGVQQWRARPKAGQQPTMPGWMSAVDTMTPVKAAGLGALLAAVNPKNLTLCLVGGVAIGAGGLPAGQTAVAIAVFVLIASCSIGIPTLGYLVTQERMRAPLEEMRTWLTLHNAAVMSVLLLVIGISILGQGLAGL